MKPLTAQEIWRALKLTGPWLLRPKVAWLFLAILFGLPFILNWLGCFIGINVIYQFKIAGALLQITGICVAATAIINKANILSGDHPLKRISNWLRSWPFLQKSTIAEPGAGRIDLQGYSVEAKATVSTSTLNMTLEERVEKLERSQAERSAEFNSFKKQMEKDIRDIRRHSDEQDEYIKTLFREERNQSIKAHIGNIDFELAGLGWIIFGIIFTTLPEFVAAIAAPIIRILNLHHCY